jgi:hypothetical protein
VGNNTIVQHVPAFADNFEPRRKAMFDTLDELMEVPWVKQWAGDQGFWRFSLNGNILLVERNEGRWWWVVGFLEKPVEGLPKWQGGTK